MFVILDKFPENNYHIEHYAPDFTTRAAAHAAWSCVRSSVCFVC